ncbi:SRPBCC family protein [Paenibacillus sp. UNC451MF]|uniref:SRPBCC family protein n=1 Tax=Paenibacillus sp. UNC451MF TaxID=1449063 RepID=UPI00048F13AF|nr:SRPBCC family protein [Paenibacillus sp. UNC451MF]
MLAKLQKVEKGYMALFERHFKQSTEEVWAYLTENPKLEQWFTELEVKDLRKDGLIKFNMPDGSHLDITIIDLEPHAVLAYTWGEDQVRFELSSEPSGCQLLLKEDITAITSHTPKDLAGWHVCLDVIEALLDGKTIDRHAEWERMYGQYIQAVEKVAVNP